MKIVQCFYSLTVGGAEILAIDLLNHMCQEHEASLIVVNDKWSTELLTELDKRVKVYFIKRKPGSRNPLPVLRFYRLLKRLKPDIIHCHEPNMGQLIKIKTGKLVYTIHDTGIPTDLYHHYHALVAISEAVYRDVAARYTASPISKVYNGVNAAKFSKRTNYTIQDEEVKLVQISRVIHEKKGQDILLRALALIKNTYGFQNFSLQFVGVGASMEFLKSLTAEVGLAEHVRFIGEKNRKWVFTNLCQYHILVQPSRYEGFGLTILEGFAAGLPVLASHIEGPAEIITQTAQGLLFKREDVEACAQQLYSLIQEYLNGAMPTRMMGNTALTDSTYSIEACAAGYLNEYKRVLEIAK